MHSRAPQVTLWLPSATHPVTVRGTRNAVVMVVVVPCPPIQFGTDCDSPLQLQLLSVILYTVCCCMPVPCNPAPVPILYSHLPSLILIRCTGVICTPSLACILLAVKWHAAGLLCLSLADYKNESVCTIF